MLKIRDFARLAEVSMTTLRYYDEIGLLKPIHVDPETGYRFYTIDQLPYLHRIQAFKELGLGLTQIVEVLGENLAPEALQGMLRIRQTQLQQQIQTEQEQLVRIEARLRSLEHGSSLPDYEVVLKTVRPITGVSLRLTLADLADQGHWVDLLDVMLKRYRVKPADHLLVLYETNEDEQITGFVEIVAPLADQDIDTLISRSEGQLARCELPAVPHMATTLHHGPPGLVLPAYQALGSWIENNAYTIVGPRRKISLRRGETLDEALTEVQFPVEKST
ncbi:MerR family transcriptional regulator [Dictyobacter sp. S3.2.2.5]|uniref:MerR family transcriptional regulator n=1 Tax=Dictyobacter halimunensis TaxID=3026934 RepID=A0ABQ6G3B2_9CHLR|nr:MerR family transcriptional regulator [Dictyobacter sp. S3.2.2.5]